MGLFMRPKKKILDVEKFRGISPEDRATIHQYSETVSRHERLIKYEGKQKRQQMIGSIFKKMGGTIPKGIRHPDDIVTNAHLYVGRKPGNTSRKKNKIRLY